MKIPENVVGEMFVQNDSNEFEGPFGKQNLRSFLKQCSNYYQNETSENQISYIRFLDAAKKKNSLRVEKRLLKNEWL
jgi:hypothetical protein